LFLCVAISLFSLASIVGLRAAFARPPADDDAVISRMLARLSDEEQAKKDAHHLLDVIGPRLTASPGNLAAHNWLLETYKKMGLEAWVETGAKYKGWRRGVTHADLIAPRVRTLEAIALAWSPGTKGPVEAPIVTLPPLTSPEEFKKWLPTVRGAFVMASPVDTTCRPLENWKQYARSEAVDRMEAERKKTYSEWLATFDKIAVSTEEFPRKLEAAGAAGLFVKNWWKEYASDTPLDAWGTNVIMDASSKQAPMVNLSCEDYGLLWRLAENKDHPRARVSVDAQFLGESPVENTIAKIPGTERPDETIVLTAHLDSWDAASGATDNGTGTLKMLGAMRMLHDLYPKPRRTILVRHWSGEEQGLSTTRNVLVDMSKIAPGIQLVMNQDVGTGRATALHVQGVPGMKSVMENWVNRLPPELGGELISIGPIIGKLGSEGSCIGFPVVNLWPLDKATQGYTWSYDPYTWHTNRDTYDKVIFDDVQFDSTLVAMLAYLASENPNSTPRTAENVTDPETGQPVNLPICGEMFKKAREQYTEDQKKKKEQQH
jgi:hypothetical protein